MKKKLFTFDFKSGNSCDVVIDVKRHKKAAADALHIQWDVFPPSREDQVQWKEVCVAELCEGLAKLGLIGESQLEAFCTSGDSPGKEGNDGR